MSRTSGSRSTLVVNKAKDLPIVVLSRAKDLLLLMLLTTIPHIAAAQLSARQKSDERELFRLENEWAHAVVKRDAAILHRMTAPRWVYSDETGVLEREAGIKSFTTGTDTVRDASNKRMRALIYDNSAVVIGILVMKGSGASGAFNNRYRYTDSWVKRDGRWQCIASQDYLIPAGKR